MAKSLFTRFREKVRAQRHRLRPIHPQPDWVQVEINNTCNLNCIMCPREAMTRPLRHMTLAEFQDIAQKVHAAGVAHIRLFLLGEPLLHRDLVSMIRYAKQIGIPSVEINTNAVLLDEPAARALIAAGLDEIVFSIDGADAETFEAVRCGASYDEVAANIRGFFRIRGELETPKPRGVIQSILMEPTRDQMHQFVALWQPVADELRIQALRQYHGVEGLSFTEGSPDDELRPCPALWSYLVILADLTVTPCCTDINGELALGTIADGDIADFWLRNDKLNNLRRLHGRLDFADLALCRSCEFISLDVMRRKAKATSEYQREQEENSGTAETGLTS